MSPEYKSVQDEYTKVRAAIFPSAMPNDIEIREKMVRFAGSQRTTSSNIEEDVFAKPPDDENISLSRDDKRLSSDHG